MGAIEMYFDYEDFIVDTWWADTLSEFDHFFFHTVIQNNILARARNLTVQQTCLKSLRKIMTVRNHNYVIVGN